LTVSADFNHELQTVYEVLTDPDYLVDRNLALGELSSECEVEAFEDSATITAVREIERDLPAFLARLFNPVSVLDMKENWRLSEDRWSGDWTMRIRSRPTSRITWSTSERTRHRRRSSAAVRGRIAPKAMSS
jgi:hypothetical protein